MCNYGTQCNAQCGEEHVKINKTHCSKRQSSLTSKINIAKAKNDVVHYSVWSKSSSLESKPCSVTSNFLWIWWYWEAFWLYVVLMTHCPTMLYWRLSYFWSAETNKRTYWFFSRLCDIVWQVIAFCRTYLEGSNTYHHPKNLCSLPLSYYQTLM